MLHETIKMNKSEVKIGNLVSTSYCIDLAKKKLEICVVPTKENLKEILSLPDIVGSHNLILTIYDDEGKEFSSLNIYGKLTNLEFSGESLIDVGSNVYLKFIITKHGVTYV